MKKLITSLIILICITACGTKSPFFPHNTFSERDDLNELITNWYSTQLEALGENSIFARKGKSKTNIYRFTLLRTSHHPLTVRIESKADSAVLHFALCDGASGYEPGEIKEKKSIKLSDQSLKQITIALEDLGFWGLPTNKDYDGLDGSHWIIEVLEGENYHIVDRWTPDKGTPVRVLGEIFLSLAEFKPKELY